MALKDKLDTAWTNNLMQDATFEFRATAEACYDQLITAVARIDALVALAVFTNVDTEIKIEGNAIRTIINNAKTSLDAHSTFLRWRQP